MTNEEAWVPDPGTEGLSIQEQEQSSSKDQQYSQPALLVLTVFPTSDTSIGKVINANFNKITREELLWYFLPPLPPPFFFFNTKEYVPTMLQSQTA